MNSSSSRKSSSTCASSGRPGSLRTRRAFARSAATSPASRPLRRASAPRPPNELLQVFEEPIDAEARIAGRSGEQQTGEDRRGAGGAPVYPPGHEEDGAQLQEILRPRRDQRVRDRRQGEDRGARADLEVEGLDRGAGHRTGEVRAFGSKKVRTGSSHVESFLR